MTPNTNLFWPSSNIWTLNGLLFLLLKLTKKSVFGFFWFFTHWYLKLRFVSNTFWTKIPKSSHCVLLYLTLPKKDDFFSFSGEVGAEVVLLLFWKALPDVLLLMPCSIWDPGLGGGPSVFDWSPCTLDKFKINFNIYNPFVRILIHTLSTYQNPYMIIDIFF